MVWRHTYILRLTLGGCPTWRRQNQRARNSLWQHPMDQGRDRRRATTCSGSSICLEQIQWSTNANNKRERAFRDLRVAYLLIVSAIIWIPSDWSIVRRVQRNLIRSVLEDLSLPLRSTTLPVLMLMIWYIFPLVNHFKTASDSAPALGR